jgi:hypothetical protein
MEKIIVYVSDTAHALQTLAPMCQKPPENTPTEWIVVACPPRLTRHISKWLTHSARLQWRDKWSAKVFADLTPMLSGAGNQVKTLTAQGSLVEMTDQLHKTHGVARVLDARLPLVGQELQPVMKEQPISATNRWVVPGAMVSMGTLMALASE